ncbi:MAG TPA: class I SAM-dependent methyltransferase [Solirubrobacterales bacterium]|nr:class I SAM-dependent methyltransferase [Solirubrobacterales bacterium]
MSTERPGTEIGTAVIWHDVECGAYAADLPLWEELAAGAGEVLDLGCGTGRVALHLARRGQPVVGLDFDAELLAALAERGEGLPVKTVHADAREFELDRCLRLAIAPMQTLQLLEGAAERTACLQRVATHLEPGGQFAAAILEAMPEPDGSPPPLPDVREVDGWVYSSLAIEAAVGPGEIIVSRLRQTVSPAGELSEEPNRVRIETFTAAQLEEEAAAFGLTPIERREIGATDIHVGTTVVVLGKEA